MINKIGKITISAREKARKLRNEIKKSILTAVVAAFGFLMALAWRDVISEFVTEITEISPIQGRLISALIITLISVIGILIVTKFMGEKNVEENK